MLTRAEQILNLTNDLKKVYPHSVPIHGIVAEKLYARGWRKLYPDELCADRRMGKKACSARDEEAWASCEA